MKYDGSSKVESIYLDKTEYKFIYPPEEKIKSIITLNFPVLGKLTSLRFIEWVQKNPGGVISLPTGKTPEHFIKWTQHYLNNWNKKDVVKDLEENGINTKIYPDISSLSFIQIDEFYPISPDQQNSFNYYINKFYIKGFGLDKKKVQLIDTSKTGLPEGYTLNNIFPDNRVDLSLRTRYPKSHLEELQKNAIHSVDQFCVHYEEKIRELGGIGFFLGGIGPDGHIGFNVSGSDFFSTTRLIHINYETAAAAAADLGGIEVSRNRLVITIGLSSIIYHKDAVAIIIAAGEAKADIVARSITSVEDIQYPASILRKLPNARFYLTQGAGIKMKERAFIRLKNTKKVSKIEEAFHILNYTLKSNVPLEKIPADKLMKDRFCNEVLKKSDETPYTIKKRIRKDLIKKINAGIKPVLNSVILHTSPHHDDEMLGYLPYIMHLVREKSNTNYFSYMTSGFTSVTNTYMVTLLEKLKYHLTLPRFKFLINDGYFTADYSNARNDDIYYFLDGLASDSPFIQDEAITRRLLRIIVEVYDIGKLNEFLSKVNELIDYFKTQYPGKKDPEHVQKIKGMIREFEAELVWGYFGFESSSVLHARLGFYTGDIFSRQPEMKSDVIPVYNILMKTRPDIVTVALDPEGSGPDTHYKVLQAISEALKKYEKRTGRSNIRIWGYRNVWYRFHPADANLYIPTSLNAIAVLNHSFLNCFGSQRDASFPSYEYDGPFSKLAQRILVQQYMAMKRTLGEEYFYNNPHPRIRATRGLVFLKELSLKEFYKHSMELKRLIEV
ncbi:MAG: glucosamine-6-phosphate deaminase [Spirochaetes bacterium]|nr:glucosamine-6-phosphate deaminase [Spirochaetota bacterium]